MLHSFAPHLPHYIRHRSIIYTPLPLLTITARPRMDTHVQRTGKSSGTSWHSRPPQPYRADGLGPTQFTAPLTEKKTDLRLYDVATGVVSHRKKGGSSKKLIIVTRTRKKIARVRSRRRLIRILNTHRKSFSSSFLAAEKCRVTIQIFGNLPSLH